MNNEIIEKLQGELDKKDRIIQSLTVSIESLSWNKCNFLREKLYIASGIIDKTPRSMKESQELRNKYEYAKIQIKKLEKNNMKKEEIIQKYFLRWK